MKPALQILWQAIRIGVSCLWGFAVWGLWLALCLLLALQLYVVSSSELAVPAFVLRRIEHQLARSGIHFTFSRTSFDPTGRVLVENVQAYLPEFTEPVFTARAVYCRLNPWMLVVGRFEPRELRVIDATALVPAMLSRSGRPEEIIRNLDATISPVARQFELHQFSARVAGVVVSARGAVPAPNVSASARPEITTWIAQHFPVICRQAMAVSEQLAAFEQPSLELEVSSSETGGAIVNVLVLARTARIEIPVAAEASDVRVATRALFQRDVSISQLDFSAVELRLPFETTARHVQANVDGGFRPGGGFQFEPRRFEVTADSIASRGFSAAAVSAELMPRPLPRLEGTVVGHVAGAPLAVQARADFGLHTAGLTFRGSVSPGILAPLSEQFGVDVRRYFDFEQLDCDAGSVRLGPEWKFEYLTTRVRVHNALAYGVRLDEGRATIAFDGRRFDAPEAYARIGENFARGSYEQDLQSRAFRFLLAGQLRPMDISGWFRPWWPGFFRQFEFPAAPPIASVDVNGIWGNGRRSAVFVFAEAPKVSIRGAAFDQFHTRLFIRPGFYDGLEVFATHGGSTVEGTFTYEVNLGSGDWRRLDLNLKSTLGLDVAAKLIGPAGEKYFTPYSLSTPPVIDLKGRFEGPASPNGVHQTVDVAVRTMDELRFNDFPVRDATFDLKIRDDEISVSDLEARVAGGTVAGRARVWGTGPDRRTGFDLTLKDASLGESVVTLQEFFARRRGESAAPPGKLVQEKANVRVELDASAEGAYADPFSYHGSGNVVLRGAEIGAVPLLGSLSDVLKFTTLRFTEARGTFKIDGKKLAFSEITLRGSNSAIDAHGVYALDARELDFNAKIFPFHESGNLVKTVVGAVLAPISNAMEVKLTGSLESPAWGLVLLGGTGISAANEPEKQAKPTENGTTTPPTNPEGRSTSDAKP